MKDHQPNMKREACKPWSTAVQGEGPKVRGMETGQWTQVSDWANRLCLALCLLTLPACAADPLATAAPPAAVAAPTNSPSVFSPAKLAELDAAITRAINNGNTPGAVVWIEHAGQVYTRAYGRRAVQPEPETMTTNTIFDVASLTKVMATAPSIMLLLERGRLELDQPVAKYLPEFTGLGREKITLRHLLTHYSGLPSGLTRRGGITNWSTAIAQAVTEKPGAVGASFRYSDANFILLGEIVRRVSGRELPDFAREEFFVPLGMTETRYWPPAEWQPRIAPTERAGGRMLRGTVHDPTARLMGGAAGHAGLFSTVQDTARFCRMLLNGGELDGKRVLKEETVKLMTSTQSPEGAGAKRGLGWDIDTPYSGPRGKVFPVGSYGHTGWTGTSIWIDPGSRTFVLLFANRNHPAGDGSVVKLRSEVATLAAESLLDVKWPAPPPATNAPARP